MPVFPNPNGGSMVVSGEAEARANGWTPSMGSFGVNSFPESGGGSPGGSPAPSSSSPNLAAISAGFAASAGMTQKQLDEQIREFDKTLEWQKQQWAEKGLPELAIEQRAQALEEQKFAELTAEATRQQNWVEEIGRRQATLAEKTQSDANLIAQGQLGVQQGQLASDVLKTAASLTGPSDWIKASNYNRGIAQTNLPGFITNLLQGRNTAVLGGVAPGSTMSNVNSMFGLGTALGAGGLGQNSANFQASGGTGQQMSDVDYAAQQLRNVYAQGGNALGPQQLEGLTPTELSMFTGGGSDVGADVNGFLDAYKKSRIGQQSSLPGLL